MPDSYLNSVLTCGHVPIVCLRSEVAIFFARCHTVLQRLEGGLSTQPSRALPRLGRDGYRSERGTCKVRRGATLNSLKLDFEPFLTHLGPDASPNDEASRRDGRQARKRGQATGLASPCRSRNVQMAPWPRSKRACGYRPSHVRKCARGEPTHEYSNTRAVRARTTGQTIWRAQVLPQAVRSRARTARSSCMSREAVR